MTNTRQIFLFIGIFLSTLWLIIFTKGIINYLWISGNIAKDGQPVARDFATFWIAALMLVERGATSVYDLGLFNQNYQIQFLGLHSPMFPYPPLTLLFIWPLGFMHYKIALAIWIAVSFTAFIIACNPPYKKLPLYIIAFVLAPNVTFALFSGQNGLLTSALLIAGMRLSLKRPVAAGMIFGLMIVKPQLALMIPVYLLATRNWRALMAAAFSAAGLICASIIAFTSAPWKYLSETSKYLHTYEMTFQPGDPSLYMFIIALNHQYLLAFAAQLLCIIIVAATSFHAFVTTRDHYKHFLLFAAGTFLMMFHGGVYDTPILAVAVLLILHDTKKNMRWYEMVLYGLVWFFPIAHLVCPTIGPLILLLFYAHVYYLTLYPRTTNAPLRKSGLP